VSTRAVRGKEATQPETAIDSMEARTLELPPVRRKRQGHRAPRSPPIPGRFGAGM
jgi:hypothetical protein